MENSKGKASFGIICILLIIVLCLGGYIAYDKGLIFSKGNVEDKNNDNNKDNKDNNVVEDKELALNDYTVVKLYGYVLNQDDDIKDYFHSNSELTNKTVSNEMKLRIAYQVNGKGQYKYSKVISGLNPQTVYTADVNVILGQINEIFGSDNGYSHNNEGIQGALGADCGELKYVQSQNNYELKIGEGCGGITTYALYTKLVKAVKTKDSIVLTEKSYVLYSHNEVAKDLTRNSPVIATNANPSDEYFDKGSTVTYTFKLSDNGTYYFSSSKITY